MIQSCRFSMQRDDALHTNKYKQMWYKKRTDKLYKTHVSGLYAIYIHYKVHSHFLLWQLFALKGYNKNKFIVNMATIRKI